MIYFIVSQLSSIFRTFIENPLESFISYSDITIKGIVILIFILRFWPMIMHGLTYGIVGGVYKSGEFPVLGSILYFITFWINSNVLKFLVEKLGSFGLTVVIVPFLIICIIELIGMHKLRNSVVGEISI